MAMGSLDKRLRALEGGGRRCEECGITPVEGPVTFTIGEPLKWAEEPPQLEFCARCGQMTGGSFTLDIGSAAINPRSEGEAAEG